MKLITCAIAVIGIFILYQIAGCPFLFIFGIPCPGCGMTRAWLAFFHGDISNAFKWHPLFPAVIPFFWIVITKKGLLFGSKSCYNIFIIGSLILVIIVYALRMRRLFPDTEPMLYNNGALVNKLFTIMKRGKL